MTHITSTPDPKVARAIDRVTAFEIIRLAQHLDRAPEPELLAGSDLVAAIAAAVTLVRRAAGRFRNLPGDRTDWPNDAAELLLGARDSALWREYMTDNRRRSVWQFAVAEMSNPESDERRLGLAEEWRADDQGDQFAVLIFAVHLLRWIADASGHPDELLRDLRSEIASGAGADGTHSH